MKRMSFAATTAQMYDRSKTVTRRTLGTWADLAPGDTVMAIEKGMGLAKGERQKCIHAIEILANDPIPLLPLTATEVAAEGFPDRSPEWFIAEVWTKLHGPETDIEVQRLEFRHRLDLWVPGFLPSNGTHGGYFRAVNCNKCDRDHVNHGSHGVVDPGCLILCDAMTAYPNPGPKEWERRILGDADQVSTWTFEERCTAFEACGPCAEAKAAEQAKQWPIEATDAWKPRQAQHVDGQVSLL